MVGVVVRREREREREREYGEFSSEEVVASADEYRVEYGREKDERCDE